MERGKTAKMDGVSFRKVDKGECAKEMDILFAP